MPHMYEKMARMASKKKNKEPMSDMEKKAKMGVLGSLRDEMSGMMSDKLKSLKKVSVASDTKEGLKKGLEKAEEMVERAPGDEETKEEVPMGEAGESEEEYEAMSKEELDSEIKEMEAHLEGLKKLREKKSDNSSPKMNY